MLVTASLAVASFSVLGDRTPPAAVAAPPVRITTEASGLNIPWDLTWVGSTMLFTQRSGTIHSKQGSAAPARVNIPLPPTFANGEGGLLGIVGDPQSASNQRFYTCQATANPNGTAQDVRVQRWRLTAATTAVSDGAPLITGLPLSTGRHSGCRLRFGADAKLYVGTGDAAIGTNPQDIQSLGGKILRVNADGSIPTDNPFFSQGGNARYVWTYGHRNVQGLALRPGTSQMWSVEHGSSRDDEVNVLGRGRNHGWDPVPGYDESTPMTDLAKFPDAQRAAWSSGSPTIAASGATFVTGGGWGSWQGALAIAVLKDRGIRLLFLDPNGIVVRTEVLPGTQAYGRVRSVQLGPDRALYFTTSNGGSNDIIGKITPTATSPVYRPGLDVSPIGVAAVRTGADVYAFVRGPQDNIFFRRSTDDGRTWPTTWTNTGIPSASGPAVTSSSAGRVDLFTRTTAGATLHSWFVDGVARGTSSLGGVANAAPAASSPGDGTLDVFVRARSGQAFRNHYDGRSWSGWMAMGGGFTSALSAAVNKSTDATTVTGRGKGASTYERVVTPTSNGTAWVRNVRLSSWSMRALGDIWPGRQRVGVSLASDGAAVVDRGALVMAVPGVVYDSGPAVVTRPDGTWMIFGRSPSGGLRFYDARPGGHVLRNLGGIVR